VAPLVVWTEVSTPSFTSRSSSTRASLAPYPGEIPSRRAAQRAYHDCGDVTESSNSEPFTVPTRGNAGADLSFGNAGMPCPFGRPPQIHHRAPSSWR